MLVVFKIHVVHDYYIFVFQENQNIYTEAPNSLLLYIIYFPTVHLSNVLTVIHHLWTSFLLCLSIKILHSIYNVQLYIQAEVFLEFIYLPEGSALNSCDVVITNQNNFLEWQKAEVGMIIFFILPIELSQAAFLERDFWSYLSNTGLPNKETLNKKNFPPPSPTSKLDSNLRKKLISATFGASLHMVLKLGHSNK